MCDPTLIEHMRAIYDKHLPEWPGSRAELVGVLIYVSPPAPARYQRIQDELRARLDRVARPDQAITIMPVVEMASGERYMPDLELAAREVIEPTGSIDAEHAVLVVEVVLPVGNDDLRATKVAGYAASGVAACMLVDPRRRTATLWSNPAGGGYLRMRKAPFGAGLELPAPLRGRISISALG
jgi:Uma2 family endonuclease